MRSIALALTLSASFGLAACGGADTPAEPETPAAETPAPEAEAPAPEAPYIAPTPPEDAFVYGTKSLRSRFTGRDQVSPEIIIGDGDAGVLISGGPALESANLAARTTGASVRLPVSVESDASGARVRVTISARAEAGAAQDFAAAYATNDVGSSEWARFTLDERFQAFSFDYDVPVMQDGGGDHVAIWPDASGEGRGVEIEFIAVEVVGAQ